MRKSLYIDVIFWVSIHWYEAFRCFWTCLSIPHTQTNEEYDNYKEILFIQGKLQRSRFYFLYRFRTFCLPVLTHFAGMLTKCRIKAFGLLVFFNGLTFFHSFNCRKFRSDCRSWQHECRTCFSVTLWFGWFPLRMTRNRHGNTLSEHQVRMLHGP